MSSFATGSGLRFTAASAASALRRQAGTRRRVMTSLAGLHTRGLRISGMWSTTTAFSCCPGFGSTTWHRMRWRWRRRALVTIGKQHTGCGRWRPTAMSAPSGRHLLPGCRLEVLCRADFGTSAGAPRGGAESGMGQAVGCGLARGPVPGTGSQAGCDADPAPDGGCGLGRHRVPARCPSRWPSARPGGRDGPGVGTCPGSVSAGDLPRRGGAKGRLPAAFQRQDHDGACSRTAPGGHG